MPTCSGEPGGLSGATLMDTDGTVSVIGGAPPLVCNRKLPAGKRDARQLRRCVEDLIFDHEPMLQGCVSCGRHPMALEPRAYAAGLRESDRGESLAVALKQDALGQQVAYEVPSEAGLFDHRVSCRRPCGTPL